MDLDRFEERAAIMEFDGGMTRFAAETAAARAQGYQRHEVMNALRARHSQQARDQRSAAARDAADDLPRMQPAPEQENRPLPERHVQAGRGAVDVLALRDERRGVV